MTLPKVRILRVDAETDKVLGRAAAIEDRDREDIAADLLAVAVAATFNGDGRRVKTQTALSAGDSEVDRLLKLANSLREVG